MSSYVRKIAGKIKFHLKEWKSITSDQTILDIVKGCKFDFMENSDQIDQRETFTNIKEAAIIDNEIDKLAQIGVIEKANHCEGEFISTIFLRPKSDGTHRMILNLKIFNKSINYVHFKMESLHSALQTITPNSFMGSLDIRHAYYLVNVDHDITEILLKVALNTINHIYQVGKVLNWVLKYHRYIIWSIESVSSNSYLSYVIWSIGMSSMVWFIKI